MPPIRTVMMVLVVAYPFMALVMIVSYDFDCGREKLLSSQVLNEKIVSSLDDDNSTLLLEDTVHVLFATSGNSTDSMRELEVALKSVLLHAPTHNPLTIHILVDTDAYLAIGPLIHTTANIEEWATRNPVQVHVYHISQATVASWKQELRQFFQGAGYEKSKMPLLLEHSIGAYFRLYAHRVLPPERQCRRFLYMDTDIVLFANLQLLTPLLTFQEGDHEGNHFLFHWTPSMCSGFMVIETEQIPQIWTLASNIDLKQISRERLKRHRPNDQLILRAINMTYPERVGLLDSEVWDGHIADTLWRFPFKVSEKLPRLGMIHFNGGGADMGAYFEQHEFLTQENPDTHNTFGLAREQVYMPWSWAKFQVETRIRPGRTGYPIKITTSYINA